MGPHRRVPGLQLRMDLGLPSLQAEGRIESVSYASVDGTAQVTHDNIAAILCMFFKTSRGVLIQNLHLLQATSG